MMNELTKGQIDEIKSKLGDQMWRLENLYWITDVEGRKIKFKMNAVQRLLYTNRWFRNIVLKSRQQGITTFVAIFFLDSVLFESNQQALIIAHTQGDARKIFDTKIKFAFDNLPEWLRTQYKVNVDNMNVLKFETNGSSISVATSGRSGTYQYLHISEFGVLCVRFPEKAKEIVTGTLNTAHVGKSVIFIESTAKGRAGYFYDYCIEAMNNALADNKLTPMDWKFFFFPWFENKEDVLDGEVVITSEMEEYFTSLKERYGIELTNEQKNWYIKKSDEQGEDMFAEFPSIPEEAFKASIEGAYYTKQISRMYADKRVTKVPYDPELPVYTFWDIGVGDETVIGFVQFIGLQIRLIDEYYAAGEGLQHYARILQERADRNDWIYAGHYGPHDMNVREIGSNAMTRKDIARSLGINFYIVKKHGIDVGIDKTRMMLNKLWIDESRCAKTLAALQSYRKEFDEQLGTWGSKPMHSWESHYADMIRQLAMSYESIIGSSSFGIGHKRDEDEEEFYNGNRKDDSFDRGASCGGLF